MSAEAMTERFEMRLGQSVLEKVDTWRSSQGDLPSRSEAVRRLVEAGLGMAVTGRQIKLEDGDKLILIMLCQLFNQLKLKGGIEPEFVEEVIYGGHYWGLDWRYPGIFHDHEDAEAVVSEVVNVLDMWSFLEDGFGKLSKKDKERVAKEAEPFGTHVVCTGFDGNNESNHLGVARFLIDKLDRFSSFKGRDLNSHMPIIDAYRRMLLVFEPIRCTLTGRELNASEIIDVLKAWTHPSRRRPEAAPKR
ncbi:MAG TPA: YfbU family protein [Candidatus Angelobacter sp.]